MAAVLPTAASDGQKTRSAPVKGYFDSVDCLLRLLQSGLIFYYYGVMRLAQCVKGLRGFLASRIFIALVVFTSSTSNLDVIPMALTTFLFISISYVYSGLNSLCCIFSIYIVFFVFLKPSYSRLKISYKQQQF